MSAKKYRQLLANFVSQVNSLFAPGDNLNLLFFAIGNFILDEHHITLLGKVKTTPAQLFYLQQAYESGWSCEEMVGWIDSGLYERAGENHDRRIIVEIRISGC
jgi:hypothetical protein